MRAAIHVELPAGVGWVLEEAEAALFIPRLTLCVTRRQFRRLLVLVSLPIALIIPLHITPLRSRLLANLFLFFASDPIIISYIDLNIRLVDLFIIIAWVRILDLPVIVALHEPDAELFQPLDFL